MYSHVAGKRYDRTIGCLESSLQSKGKLYQALHSMRTPFAVIAGLMILPYLSIAQDTPSKLEPSLALELRGGKIVRMEAENSDWSEILKLLAHLSKSSVTIKSVPPGQLDYKIFDSTPRAALQQLLDHPALSVHVGADNIIVEAKKGWFKR